MLFVSARCPQNMQDTAQRLPQSWPPGVSGNPHGSESKARQRARIDELVAAWCRPHGGVSVLSPAELHIARMAAELSLHRPKRHVDALHAASVFSRLMSQCGLATRYGRPRDVVAEPWEPSLDEYRAKIDDALASLQRGGDDGR